ncbi:MAG: 2-C-methyl-D-erythritol 2,4-cyclodiphosphate synthase [Bacilli bacterium]|nr:2-C-methyl-D-erythritol 2,4-cyclodiphosphate synthase [Bacilli bacterium]
MSEYRIGYGEDLHRLVEGRDCILAGIKIPSEKGLLGHSDGDVVLHAVSDALLGALALGDIGELFPPTDPSIKGIDSKIILQKAHSLIKENGYRIVNLDVCVTCEKPKILPHREEMKQSLSSLLNLEMNRISLKGKTNEGVDAIGKGEAIRTTCVVLLQKD